MLFFLQRDRKGNIITDQITTKLNYKKSIVLKEIQIMVYLIYEKNIIIYNVYQKLILIFLLLFFIVGMYEMS